MGRLPETEDRMDGSADLLAYIRRIEAKSWHKHGCQTVSQHKASTLVTQVAFVSYSW